MHELATEICELNTEGRKPEALAKLGDLHGLQDALHEQLKVLMLGRRAEARGCLSSACR